LTAAQVARAVGTSETNVAAYERGDKAPNADTAARIDAAIAAGKNSAIFKHNLMTVPYAAAQIRQGLRRGWTTADLLRCVVECRDNAQSIHGTADVELFFAKPSTTGDPRWNALLAGSTEQLALRLAVDVPAWTSGHEVRPFWFVGPNRAFDAYCLAHSPASMKVRGVMIDPADLESV
jgi:DNA-binding XRE family transcriptional regulator